MHTFKQLAAAAVLAALSFGASAQSKPAELKIGISTFLSGPASVFGVPAKAAAESSSTTSTRMAA